MVQLSIGSCLFVFDVDFTPTFDVGASITVDPSTPFPVLGLATNNDHTIGDIEIEKTLLGDSCKQNSIPIAINIQILAHTVGCLY